MVEIFLVLVRLLVLEILKIEDEDEHEQEGFSFMSHLRRGRSLDRCISDPAIES